MNLFEENEQLIREIENYILNLKILDVEQKIKESKWEDNSIDEKIYAGYEQVTKTKNRLVALNQKIFNEYEELRNRLMYIDNLCTFPISIRYMESPLNKRKYLVQAFYQKIYKTYEKEPVKIIMLGFLYNFNERCLKIENLNDEEIKEAAILDKYLSMCFIQEQFEMLIDCIKCIQFNYIDNSEK